MSAAMGRSPPRKRGSWKTSSFTLLQLLGLGLHLADRHRVLEEREEDSEERRADDDGGDEPQLHVALVLIVSAADEAERAGDGDLLPGDGEARAELPALTGEAHEQDAALVVGAERPNVRASGFAELLVLAHRLQVAAQRLERGLFEALRARRRSHALSEREERDVRAGALSDLLRESLVDPAQSDHGAERGLPDLVLDGARDDARDAPSPDPRVVAEEAVQRVEHRRVAAEGSNSG